MNSIGLPYSLREGLKWPKFFRKSGYFFQNQILKLQGKSVNLPRYEPSKALLEATNFTKQELRYWHAGFMHDCPSGRLTETEFIKIYVDFLPTQGDPVNFAKLIFNLTDLDGEGTIDFEEFITMLHCFMAAASNYDLKLKWLFGLYDVNQDGSISKQELVKILTAIDELTGDVCHTPSYFEELFQELDTNHDGSVNFEEFQTLAKTNTILTSFFNLFEYV